MALPGASAPPAGYRFIETSSRGSRGTFGTNIKITGLKAAQDGLRAMNVQSVPIIDEALTDIGNVLAIGMDAVKPHASFKVGKPKILGKPHSRRVSVAIAHPGARSAEFGRKWYWRGYTGRNMKAGYKFQPASGGQKARPYLGVISGASVAQSIRPFAETKLVDAYIRQFEASHAAAGGNNS